jgi:hypothetical protein
VSSAVTVEESCEPGGLVRTQCDLFDDADTAAVVHGGPDQVLQVYRGEVSWVEIVKTD